MDTKSGLFAGTSTHQVRRSTSRENQAESKRAWMAYESQSAPTSAVTTTLETSRSMPEMPIRNFLRVVFTR